MTLHRLPRTSFSTPPSCPKAPAGQRLGARTKAQSQAHAMAWAVVCLGLALPGAAAAQPLSAAPTPADAAAGLRWQWATSAGVNHYREPSLDMQLQGPELGLHLRLSEAARWPRWAFEGDVLAGEQRYDSPSGVLHGAENLESRWRLLYQAVPREGGGLYLGPAVHTLYNDLRGRTSRNHAGYQRENIGLWLAGQWRQPLRGVGPSGLQLDAGRLIRARHYSYLSQASSLYPDLGNTQRHGWYAQVQLNFQAHGLLLQPFVRHTRLQDSEPSTVGFITGLEPASRRWQIGLSVAWPPR